MQIEHKFAFQQGTMANGTTSCVSQDLEDYNSFCILTPASFEGTSLALYGSRDQGTTWYPIYFGGSALAFACGASQLVATGTSFAVPWLKLVSNIATGADRVLEIWLQT